MNMNTYNRMIVFCLVLISNSAAVVRITQQNGFGSRAFSLAQNSVAISNDISGLYYNPAGMAFSPAVEFHLSANSFTTVGNSELFETGMKSSMRKIQLSSSGVMFSLPAQRGGLTFAISYINPVRFDDLSIYAAQFSPDISTTAYLNKVFRLSGGLNFWTAGFGLQVAPNTAVGLSVSYVNGRDELQNHSYHSINGFAIENTGKSVVGRYNGLDVRGGLAYKNDKFSAGVRFAMPQVISVKDAGTDIDSVFQITDRYEDYGKMYSSYNGAVGASYTLPFVTITAEGRGILPFDYLFSSVEIPGGSQAKYFKLGGGVGIEFPLIVKPLLFRLGYSYDEIDLHQYVLKYNDETEFDWSDENTRVDRNKHQITAGIGFFSSNVAFDIAYGFATWRLVQKDDYGRDALFQEYLQNKVAATVSFRY